MLEMLLVPLLALGLIAIPVLHEVDDIDNADLDDDGMTPPTPTTDLPADTPPAEEDPEAETPAAEEDPVAETPAAEEDPVAETPAAEETPVAETPASLAAASVSIETGGVIATNPDVAETEVPGVFTVSATDDADIIAIDQTTARFLIAPGSGADAINIGLNSDVTMAEPIFGNQTETRPEGEDDSASEGIFEQTDTADLDADEITLNITQAGIDGLPEGLLFGSQIDLSDPDDALVIEVDAAVAGNLHLIQIESGAGSDATDFTALSTMVLLAGPEVLTLTAAQAQAIAEGEDTDITIERLAVLDQGTRFLDASDTVSIERDDLNEEPMIASNREILSVTRVVIDG